MKKKIIIVSQDYFPTKTSAAVMMGDLAEELCDQNADVLVWVPISGNEGALESQIYKRNGVVIEHFKTPIMREKSYIVRCFFEALLPFFLIKNIGVLRFFRAKPDLVVWYSPTVFFGLVIFLLKLNSKCKSYLILRDIFPEWALDLRLIRKGLVYYFLKTVSELQYCVADRIGVQSESNLSFLPRHKSKIEVLYNWITLKEETKFDLSDISNRLIRKNVFVYIGNMGIAQNLDLALKFSTLFKDFEDTYFLFIGRGSEFNRLERKATRLAHDRVVFHKEIESKYIKSILLQCTAGIVCLDYRHQTHNIPGKFMAYLDSGLPTIAFTSKESDLAKLITHHNVGSVFLEDELQSAFEYGCTLIEHKNERNTLRKRCMGLASRGFSTKSAAKQILGLLD